MRLLTAFPGVIAIPLWRRLIFSIILLYPAAKAFLKVLRFYQSYDINNWAATEFLLNYSGGFLRRGLAGSLLLELHKLIPQPLVLQVTLLLALLVTIATSICLFFACTRLSMFDSILLAYSPLLYPLYLSIYPIDAFRKDSLMLLFVIACTNSFVLPKDWRRIFLFTSSFVLLPLLTLIHEMSPFICLAPLLLILIVDLFDRGVSIQKSLFTAALFSLSTLATLMVIRNFSYPPIEAVYQSCSSWKEFYPELICSPLRKAGAFSTLADYSISQNMLNWIHSDSQAGRFRVEMFLFIVYVLCMVCGPLARLVARQSFCDLRKAIPATLAIALLALTPTIPLYWLATDFGRWMALGLTTIFLLVSSKRFTQRLTALMYLKSIELPHGSISWLNIRSLYANLSGIVLLINLVLIPQGCCVRMWNYGPVLRIVMKPFGL
jgi:hypothetical protein